MKPSRSGLLTALLLAILTAAAGIQTKPALALIAVSQATVAPTTDATPRPSAESTTATPRAVTPTARVTSTRPMTATAVLTATILLAGTAERIVTATVPVSATSAKSGTSTPVPLTSVLMIDDFQAKCTLRTIDDDEHKFGCEDGEYAMVVKQGGYIWRASYGDNYDDGVISVEARAPGGDTGVAYGLAVRITTDGQYYMFSVNPNGEYSFFRYSPTAKWTALIKNTASDVVRKGAEKNQLEVIMQGNQFALYVNNQFLDTVTDSTIKKGALALVVSSDNDNGRVNFDNVIISKINRPLPLPDGKPKPPTPTPMPAIPEGMGALIVYNYYGREVNFDIGGKLYKIAGNGTQTVILPPGKYNWSADIPGLGRAGGSAEIVAGRFTPQSFADR